MVANIEVTDTWLRLVLSSSYTALPLLVNMFHEWARFTAKYRCGCKHYPQAVLAYNAYGYRCTDCDLPRDIRGKVQVFSITHGAIS